MHFLPLMCRDGAKIQKFSANNARQTTVKLDFLDAGAKYDCAIYQDGKNADYEKNPKAYTILHRTVKKGDVLKVKQARGGGFAVSLMKK